MKCESALVVRAVVCFVACTVVSGCDRVYRTQQPIEIVVTHANSSDPVPKASVQAATQYIESFYPELSLEERRDKWFTWKKPKTYKTDENGYASLDLDIYTVCGGVFPGWFPGFDSKKDRVTGVRYLFRITKGRDQEIVPVLMRTENEEPGREFRVKVLSIGPPTLAKIGA